MAVTPFWRAGPASRVMVAAASHAAVWWIVLTTIAAASGPPDPKIVASPEAARPDRRDTFSLTYTVTIDARHPATALVRWELVGIDEVKRVRLKFDPDRFARFEGSGTLERRRETLLWVPAGPYARLQYTVRLNHRRAPGKGYDSYADHDWIVTRTRDLFPRSAVLFRRTIEPDPESRARLVFELPADWNVVSVMPEDGAQRFRVETEGSGFDHPRGWLILGRFRRTDARIDGTAVTVAAPAAAAVEPARVLDLLQSSWPAMHAVLKRMPARLLVVIAPDPMWRGGLSGEDSFYIHDARQLQTPDHTSPYLHELFHVSVPFRPGPDGYWVTEGLAEYYSLEILRRIGRVDDRDYRRALTLFRRYGTWHRDLSRSEEQAARTNSAPFVLAALDQRLRAVTDGRQTLDDVVTVLAEEGGMVTTARVLGTVQRVAGTSFGPFFRRHVYRGEPPALHENASGEVPRPGG